MEKWKRLCVFFQKSHGLQVKMRIAIKKELISVAIGFERNKTILMSIEIDVASLDARLCLTVAVQKLVNIISNFH